MLKIKNNPTIHYIEDGCFKYTFEAKKVKIIVEKHCVGNILNLFAGKTKLNVTEIRVDISNEFEPDFNMDAKDYIRYAIKENHKYDSIIYDPPWNERKSKEFYNGKYIGKFTKLKDGIVSLLKYNGRIISAGYEISNFGKKRNMEIKKIYTINPFGEIRPYFISIEKLVPIPDLNKFI